MPPHTPPLIPTPTTTTTTITPAALHIALIGAGIGGLTLALALTAHNPHLHLTLYESRTRFSEIGAGVGFGPNAVQAMTLISPQLADAYTRVKSVNADPSKDHLWFEVYGDGDGEEGGKIAELVAQEGYSHGGASRSAFLEELVGLLPEEVGVEFECAVESVEEIGAGEAGVAGGEEVTEAEKGRLRVRFTNGKTITADAVIGCDGIRSTCRRLLLGPSTLTARAVYSGKYAYRAVLDMSAAVAAVGPEIENRVIYCRRGGHVLCFPIMGGRKLNLVVFRDAEGRPWDGKGGKWVVGSSRGELLEDFAGWGVKVKRLLELIEHPDKWALFDHPPAPTYVKGGFCLLGDAAHATTPHCGAGAGMCIEDAYVLSGLLTPELIRSQEDLKAAFKAYDAVRRPRTQELVRKSRAQGRRLDLQSEEGDGEVGMGELREKMEETMKWVWEVDLKAHLAEARGLMRQCSNGRLKQNGV